MTEKPSGPPKDALDQLEARWAATASRVAARAEATPPSAAEIEAALARIEEHAAIKDAIDELAARYVATLRILPDTGEEVIAGIARLDKLDTEWHQLNARLRRFRQDTNQSDIDPAIGA